MASISLKTSIWSLILSLMIYTLSANSIGSDGSEGRNKVSLTIQEPIEEEVLSDYNPLSNRALYLDKIDKLGAIINPKQRIGSNFGQLSGYESHQKRQIRYHQCYFNPISCFRRRK